LVIQGGVMANTPVSYSRFESRPGHYVSLDFAQFLEDSLRSSPDKRI